MPFWIAYADNTGAKDAGTETMLQPGPARVDYPDGPAGVRKDTTDGTVIVQQPNVDNRVRSWVWERWPGWSPTYQALWDVLEPLRSRYRKMAGDTTPYVYLKEDETKLLRTISVTGTTVTPTYAWFRCRVIGVTRKMRTEGSSLVVYDETRLEFVIDDPAFNDLG